MGWMAPWRHRSAKMVVVKDHQQREPSMGDITTIGLDLAKHVFQVHGVDETGGVMVRKRLRRSQVLAFFSGIPPCLVGLEACATAHHWALRVTALIKRASFTAQLCEGDEQQERCGRRRGDLRGRSATVDALRTDKKQWSNSLPSHDWRASGLEIC